MGSLSHWVHRYFVDNGASSWWLTGLRNTLLITVLALCIGVVLGFTVAIIRSTYEQTGKLKVLNAIFYGLELKDLPAYPQEVERVTTEEIQRVARAYLRPSRLAIVLVGDAKAFLPDLKKAGFDTYELVTLDELDLSAVNLKRVRGAAPAATPPAR